jgi:hypothetical protein
MARLGDTFIITALTNALVPEKSEFRFTLRIFTRILILLFILFALLWPLKPLPRAENFSPINHAGNLPAIYGTLIALPEPGPIVEFPLLLSMKSDIYIYQYFSLYHRRKLFNGNSGYAPYGNKMMWSVDLPLDAWVKYFRVLGIKFIVSHPPDFIVRIIESSYKNTGIKIPPLPPPDPKRVNSIIWIDPIEKAVYMNGLLTPEINEIIKILGINILNPDAPADCGRDKFIVDLGHDTSRLVKPGIIPDLPTYTTRNGDVLSIAHSDLGKMIADLGDGAHYILLQHGIDRIVVNGFRYLFEENLRNPFLNITEPEAQKLGLSKVAEAEERVIWRIEPKPDIKITKELPVQWNISTMNQSDLKIEATLSVPPGTAWKNPNLYGYNKGHIQLKSTNLKSVSDHDIFINIPLAITEHRSVTTQTFVQVKLPPGHYNLLVSVPDLSPTTREFQITIQDNNISP